MQTPIVVDQDGHVGRVVEREYLDQQHVLIELHNGLKLVVESHRLQTRDDGSYYLPFSLTEALRSMDEGIAAVLPLVAEELHVEKTQREVGKVRIHKHVQARQVQVEETRYREHVEVRRVPVNQYVEEAPAIRYEGDTMIIPLVEEVIVVEKRLMVREEIHVSKQRITEQEPLEVTLRTETAEIERTGGEQITAPTETLDHLAATRQTNTQG